MSEIVWEEIEPVLRPHATVANGRELHWIGWCWQILDHQGLTTYGSEPEKAMVLMRALALMRVQQDYAFIMLEIDQTLEETVVFNELCKATGCTERATLLWEHKRIMSVLVDAYVEWSPLVSIYDPALTDDFGWSVQEVLEDLNKTLPPEEEGLVRAMYPDGFSQATEELYENECRSLKDYHSWLDGIREAHISLWLKNDWVLSKSDGSYDEGVRLYYHVRWVEVEAFFEAHACWGSAAELQWYRDMWDYMQDTGYTGYRMEREEISESMVRLVHLYQTYCCLALDRPIAVQPTEVLNSLLEKAQYHEQDSVEWEPNTLIAPLVARTGYDFRARDTGRFGRRVSSGGREFLRRLEKSLPIAPDSLAVHYGSRSSWKFDVPFGGDLAKYNAQLLKERMLRLEHWAETGMVT